MWANTRSVFLMPDRTNLQLVLRDPKRPFRFGQLDVTFPQHRRIGLAEIRSQQVAAVRQRRPIVPPRIAGPGDAQVEPCPAAATSVRSSRRTLRPRASIGASAGPAARLAVASSFNRPLSADACIFLERLFQPIDEPLVHRLFLLAAIHAAGQDERFFAIRSRTSFTSTPSWTSRQSLPVKYSSNCRSIAFGVPTMYCPAAPARYFRFSSLTMPRSITQTRFAWPYFRSIASTISSTVVESWRLPAKTS